MQNRDVHDLLVHAFQCELPDCQDSDCIKVKELYGSSIQSHDYGYRCNAFAYGCCDLCAKMWYFLKLHARNCKKEFCYVPRCSYLKDSMKLVQPMRSCYLQQAAAMEMIRQRAAESVPDTMD